MGVESVIDTKAIGQVITRSADTCDMVGLVSILSQIAMGFIILVTMISKPSTKLVKRRTEHPRRRWPVFALDISKQFLSSLTIHFVNLHLSVTAATSGDQCETYLSALFIDVSVGVALCWIGLRFCDILFAKAGCEQLVSGNYFVLQKIDRKREYFISYGRWALQCLVWCVITSAAKYICVLLQFKYLGFILLAKLALAIVGVDNRIRILAVVVVFPIVGNILQVS